MAFAVERSDPEAPSVRFEITELTSAAALAWEGSSSRPLRRDVCAQVPSPKIEHLVAAAFRR